MINISSETMQNSLSWSERGIVTTEVVGLDPAKPKNLENSNLHGFELHRPSSKGTKILFQVIQAIMNQSENI